ncbi:MAG: hypothetical protein M0Q12_09440 [Synergistaceae bacterium]|nr:hypothetical protein [Synergistaceae bacterium]
MSYILPDGMLRVLRSGVVQYYMDGDLIGGCKDNSSWSLKYTNAFSEGCYFVGNTGEQGLLDRMYACNLYPLKESNFWYPPKLTVTGSDGYYYLQYDGILVGIVTKVYGWTLNRMDGIPFLRGTGGLDALLTKMAELNLYGVVV